MGSKEKHRYAVRNGDFFVALMYLKFLKFSARNLKGKISSLKRKETFLKFRTGCV
jgi:hypothetical protein